MTGPVEYERLAHKGGVRVLLVAAAVLLTSAVVHTLVFLAQETPWDGHVSWRKPIVFALSFAITDVTIAWVLHALPHVTGKLRLLAPTFALTGCAEVGLITLQQWRGVLSHFNAGTPFDVCVVIVIGALFVPLVLSLLGIGVWSWRSLPRGSSLTLGMRIGMAFLILGQVAGVMVMLEGISLLKASRGNVAALYPAIEALKMPHAVSLHALQALCITGALADRVFKSRRTGNGIVLLGSLAILATLAISLA